MWHLSKYKPSFIQEFSALIQGWSGGAKVSCISRHWGIQLILAYSWARPAILIADKGRGGMFYFFRFFTFTPVLLSSLSLSFIDWLIVLGFNDTSTLVGHFVSSPREREKKDRRDSRRDEREGQGRKRNRNESEDTEEIKTSPYPYPLQG